MHQTVPEREQDKCSLAAQVLRSFGQLRLKAVGTSMLPTLWPGDLLTIEREDFQRIRPGDLILYARDRRFFVHRVISAQERVKHSALITRGDALAQPDAPVGEQEFLGKVVAVERSGGSLAPSNRFSSGRRVLGLMFSHCDRLRGFVLRFQTAENNLCAMDFDLLGST